MKELPDNYYYLNFCEMVRFVHDSYSHLLNDRELAFWNIFRELPYNSKLLYVRMLTRKGELFRLSKLNYSEIEKISETYHFLADCGFVSYDLRHYSLNEVLHLFTKNEWILLLQKKKCCTKELKKLKRSELDSFIITLFKDHDWRELIQEPILKILNQDILNTFQILYFGNSIQSLTDFVLRDIGISTFESYDMNSLHCLFNDRFSLDQTLKFYKIRDQFLESSSLSSKELLSYLNKLNDLSGLPKHILPKVNKCKYSISRELERIKDFDNAILGYGLAEGISRERLVRTLDKNKQAEKGLSLCEEIIQDPLNIEELEFAIFFKNKLAKKLSLPTLSAEVFKPLQTTINIHKNEEFSVELASAAYFDTLGNCYYVENSLFAPMFTLFFWDFIFCDVPGAFTNPFQYRPHDFYEHDFWAKRNVQLNIDWFKAYVHNNLNKFWYNWTTKKNTLAPFIYWPVLTKELLDQVFLNISHTKLAHIFLHLAKDMRGNKSGFPDLIFFPNKGGVKLFEVKGPGDSLQKNQKRWLSFFEGIELNAEVVNVRWC
ncbi:MAG: VRR-NUC domain-containing protein [Lentisphaeria bacterium]|nr:VRR-NUC domain-containing protein [Lentisphaeria bacterium]